MASELIDETDVEQFRQEFFGKVAIEFADYLIAKEVLTRWQADSLLAGRYKGFFLDQYKILEALPDDKVVRMLAENLRTGKHVVLLIEPKRDVTPYKYTVEEIAN